MSLLLAWAAMAAQAAPPPNLSEAAHAIEAHRFIQARKMLSDAMAAGEKGPEVDRLLADLAFEDGKWTEADARYSKLLEANPEDWRSAERAGLAKIMTGDTTRARELIKKAIASGHASWHAWNGLGVLCDMDRDWDGADAAFASADELSPSEPEVLNNRGWSLLLRGQWASAIDILQKAVSLDPKSTRAANNLELAKAAVAAELPQRRKGESDPDFAARLNDAGVVAEQGGNTTRAVAAFTQALEVNDSWYARAANNLKAVQPQ